MASSIRFIHTADWQLGKPFAGVDDPNKRSLLQNERFEVIRRIGVIARENQAEFVVVAGDLFDSPTATKATVSAACSAIGSIGIPVYVIPGNHDHGGAGGIWEQEFYLREQKQLAPNLHILLKYEPIELDNAILFPCPLLRRHESVDTTAWLRNYNVHGTQYGNKPRIILAHGSITSFGSYADEDESEGGAVNLIDLDRLPDLFDYIALGDWHGTKEVNNKTWYSGTPEIDRFIKGGEHNPGNILLVNVARGVIPEIVTLPTNRIGWHELQLSFPDDTGLNSLKNELDDLIGQNANLDLLHLHLDGSLGLEAYSKLEEILESYSSRLIRLKLDNRTTIAPTSEEIESLTRRTTDPLVSSVAANLVKIAESEDAEQASIARIALRELFASCYSS
jgi:DNA repair exonuclease SbcCD nuclease subunit